MDRERTSYSDSSDSTQTTAGENWWTGRGQVTLTVVTVTVRRRPMKGPNGQEDDRLH